MFATYFGAEDSKFNRGVARHAMVASVRRILKPGCKHDCVPVLQSPEGKGKSSALAALYGEENFSDQGVLGASDKDLAEALRGRWCVEVPELVGLKRSEIEKVKAAISRQTDRVRPAYGRAVIDAPRTMVFWGTTNDEEYLRALSGENRRFLPVTVGRIDVEALRRDRDQLWAEAYAEEQFYGALSLPEALWPLASEERAKRTQSDPWADELENVSAVAAAAQGATVDSEEPDALAIYEETDSEERVASRFILEDVLHLPIDRRSPEHSKRAGLAMRANGWQGPKGLRINGTNVKGFTRPIAQVWD
jgi:predicted P-loop ATPase